MTASLYHDLGELPGLRRLSAAFFTRVVDDEVLAPMFRHFSPAHVEHFAIWLAEVFGGPADFTAHHGGHQGLLRSHLGHRISDAHRARFLRLMDDTVAEVLPGRPATASAVLAYFEWGSAIAQELSQQPIGAHLGDPGDVPRWGYAGLVEG